MPIVPEYQPNLPVEGPQVPNVALQPMGPEASGVQVDQALQNMGGRLADVSDTVLMHLRMARMHDEQTEAVNLATKTVDDAQNVAGQLMQKKGKDAIGITNGITAAPGVDLLPAMPNSAVDEAYKNSFLAQSEQLKQTAMANLSPYQRPIYDRLVAPKLEALHERVLTHEANQKNIYTRGVWEGGFNSGLSVAQQMTTPGMISTLPGLLDTQKGLALNLAAQKGLDISDPNTKKQAEQQAADQTLKSAIIDSGNLQNNPDLAQKIFEAHKGEMSPNAEQNMQMALTGRLVHWGVNNFFKTAATLPGNLNADGTIKGDALISQFQKIGALPNPPVPPDQMVTAQKMLKDQIDFANTNITRQRNEDMDNIVNKGLALANQGQKQGTLLSMSDIDKQVISQFGTRLDQLGKTEALKKMHALINDQPAIEEKARSGALALAREQIFSTLPGHTPTPITGTQVTNIAQDTFERLNGLAKLNRWGPSQISQWTKMELLNVPKTIPKWWGLSSTQTFEKQAQIEVENQGQINSLKTQYPGIDVDSVIQRMSQKLNGQPPTIDQIQTVLNAYGSKH